MRAHILYGRKPFGSTPAAALAADLQSALGRRGIAAGTAEIPISPASAYGELCDLLVAQSLRFGESHDDVMIALGYPAHLMRHPRRVVWMADLGVGDGAGRTVSRGSIAGSWGGREELERQQASPRSRRFAVSVDLAETWRSLGAGSVEVLHPPDPSDDKGWDHVVGCLVHR